MAEGELLRQIEPSTGGRPSETHDGGDMVLSRSRAAADAGLTERQEVTELLIANVPKKILGVKWKAITRRPSRQPRMRRSVAHTV